MNIKCNLKCYSSGECPLKEHCNKNKKKQSGKDNHCNRHREEGKAEIAMQIAETENLARDYAGQGYE